MLHLISAKEKFPKNTNNFKVYFIGTHFENVFTLEKQGVFVNFLTQERADLLSQFRSELINLDSHVPNVSDPLWLASDLSENNFYLENFSVYILNAIAVIQHIIPKHNEVILVCDDDEGVYIYSKIFEKNGSSVLRKISYLKLFKKLVGCLFQKFLYLGWSFYNFFLLKILRYYYKVPLNLVSIQKADVVCVNWMHEKTMEGETLFKEDRYFGDLLSYLNGLDLKLAVVGKVMSYTALFKKIAKSIILKPNNLYLLQDFSSIMGLIRSFVQSFMFLKYWNCDFSIADSDLSSLWKWFCFKEILKPRLVHGLETYYASNLLFKHIKTKNVRLLYPYENQPWEKVLTISFKKYFPKNKILAYQHCAFSQDYLSAYPSKAYAKQDAPHLLLSDEFFGKWLQQENFIEFSVLGNFRYNNLSDVTTKTNFNSLRRKILCSCSIQYSDSMELVLKVQKIMENLDSRLKEKGELVVNFHPFMVYEEKRRIQEYCSSASIAWSEQSADELLKSSDLVFYNSNSICFNAALKGVPAVFVYSDLQINIDRIADVSLKATSIEEGVQVVSQLLENESDYKMYSEMFKKHFQDFFLPPQYSKIRQLFSL